MHIHQTHIAPSSIMSHMVQCSVIIYKAPALISSTTLRVLCSLLLPSPLCASLVLILSWPCRVACRGFEVEVPQPTC